MAKHDQVKWSSEDQIEVSGETRSYTCTYCRRGFSNAQALGGHMNIHRRDKARLKQFSEENNDNDNDNNKKASAETNPNRMIKNNMVNYENPNSHTMIRGILGDDHQHGQAISDDESVLKKPVFIEESTGDKIDSRDEEKRAEELDLELRLGPDRHDVSSTSTALSTREFF